MKRNTIMVSILSAIGCCLILTLVVRAPNVFAKYVFGAMPLAAILGMWFAHHAGDERLAQLDEAVSFDTKRPVSIRQMFAILSMLGIAGIVIAVAVGWELAVLSVH